MLVLIICILAAGIIAYFAFYAGKESGYQEAESLLENPVNVDAEVAATVKSKYLIPGSRNSVAHMAAFDCDDGVEREFALQKEIFDAIAVNQRDTLIYSGAIFLGFGEYGGTDVDGDEAAAISQFNDFSDDDFDENIDIEQVVESADENVSLSAEDKAAFEQFSNYERLPQKTEIITVEADSIVSIKAEHLLQKMTIYPFLKREEKLTRMFERIYSDAIDDMRGYAGDSRQGQAADDVILNGNSIRAVITTKEQPPPLRCSATVEIGVND